jgi:hypothetical protein
VRLDDGARDPEAEPHAGAVAAVAAPEGGEQVRQVLGAMPGPVSATEAASASGVTA